MQSLGVDGSLRRSDGAKRLDVLRQGGPIANETHASPRQDEAAQAPSAEPNMSSQEPEHAPPTTEAADEQPDRELEALALSSSITELDYAVQLTSSLLFEVQVCCRV